ncbi:MAG: diguanylate cyclase [Clostridiales bacterium]|nr:diguanylate cyclase [Clostridiales bacterium]
MTDAIIVIIYLTLFVLTGFSLTTAFIRDRHQRVTGYFMVFCLIIMGWQGCEILYHVSQDPLLCRIFFDVKLIFTALSAPQLLLITRAFYGNDRAKRKAADRFLLFIIPLITGCLAATSLYHPLIRAELIILQTAPVHLVRNVRGNWFWVHTAYSYLLTMAAAANIFLNHARLSRKQRAPSMLLMIGVLAVLASNLLIVTNRLDLSVDLTLIGVTVAILFFYTAIAANSTAGFLALVREEIYNCLDESVFILDERDNILDCNRSARQLLQRAGIDEKKAVHISDVIRQLSGQEGPLFEDSDEMALHAQVGDSRLSFSVKKRNMLNRQDRVIGTFASFTDVTEYERMIEALEKQTGEDPLTGLGSRFRYEADLKALGAQPEVLPLSIIMGDVNGLKATNDTLGHRMGDLLLRIVGQVMLEKLPRNGRAYRIGGDEFMLLLPGVDQQQALALADDFCETFGKIKRHPFEISVAFGVVTRVSMSERLEELIQAADELMYRAKAVAHN